MPIKIVLLSSPDVRGTMTEPSWTVERIGTSHRQINPVVTLVGMAAIVAADYFVFRHFHRHYFRWYIAQGALISLAISVVAVAVELDQDRSLISTHPGKYAASWMAVPGETLIGFSDIVKTDNRPGLDAIVTGLLGLALAGLWVCWLIVIAPLQYFVTLVAGAPARCAFASGRRTWIERQEDTTVLHSAPAKLMPEGAQEIGLARRPVSATSSIAAALLFAASQFI